MSNRALAFGPFMLFPDDKILLKAGNRVRLGARTLDLLTALAERAGDVVSNRELLACVWPQLNVEEANIRVHVAMLRKAIGHEDNQSKYIANVAGRGYRLSAPVTRIDCQSDRSIAFGVTKKLPIRLERVVGRSEIVDLLLGELQRRRFVTILGPGGIGKTTTALEVSRRLQDDYVGGARFVDLAPLQDPLLVSRAVASALDLPITTDDSLPSLTAYLKDQTTLLVIDNCEHVLDGVAAVAESLLKGTQGVAILATSREPLRAEGEWMIRLPSLQTAPCVDGLLAEEAMKYAAIELFTERARAAHAGFQLTDANASEVAELCRRLDGLPLALELAAARVGSMEVGSILARLDGTFALLNRGHRLALPRQQTLRATMDWSYDLLDTASQVVFRCLGVFKGKFTLEAAVAVGSHESYTPAETAEAISTLALKSLVIVSSQDNYTLLETARFYARGKLEAAKDLDVVRRRYANHLLAFFKTLEPLRSEAAAGRLRSNAHLIDDLRALLDWAFAVDGDVRIGLRLTAASMPLWWELSLLDEQRDLALRALDHLPLETDDGSELAEMQLKSALGFALFYTKGLLPRVHQSFSDALATAERRNDLVFQLRTLWGMFGASKVAGAYADALIYAEKYRRALPPTDAVPTAIMAGDRMMAMALHYLGRHDQARGHLANILRASDIPSRSPRAAFQYDDRITASAQLARILWIQGRPDEAAAVAEDSFAAAIRADHQLSTCFVLAFGTCPVALWRGDIPLARSRISELLARSHKYSFSYWASWGQCYAAWLDREGSDKPVANTRPRADALGVTPLHIDIMSTLGDAFVGDAAIARASAGLNGWCTAEVMRCDGNRLKVRGECEAAIVVYKQSIEIAVAQGALAWELRTATSLARLYKEHSREAEARALLGTTYARFKEGFETTDLVEARNLLQAL